MTSPDALSRLVQHISITTTWRGERLPPEAHIGLELSSTGAHMRVEVTAPYYANAAPDHAPGSTPKLWEHEVVECFILGEDGRYLEMEFGPHGHYLLLELHGERQLVEQGMWCEYLASIDPARRTWRGVAHVPLALLPPSPARYNAYAIHEVDGSRRHMARFANLADTAPNFHRLSTFGKL